VLKAGNAWGTGARTRDIQHMHRVSELHKITGRIGRRDECTAEIRDALQRAERHMTKLLLDGMRSTDLAA
jgi:hypothetical protein